ncbi:hypothetical protein HW452_17040 [Halomonas aquamarina]|uniref:Uncharacterized protein n=1 Tax=Vreelandella aquamarina TaxID=77097 RepID=A0ACC5VY62_9GAMM|nr:hypothetical protein [Halomonas aquamarina]MBZ5489228.1 hypothetical protein [Halomonas aquamarina]
MIKKYMLTITAASIMGSTAAYGDYFNNYFNSYGAARDQVLQQNTRGAFTQEDSCNMVSQMAEAIMANHLAGAPKGPVIEGEELEEEVRQLEEDYSIMSTGLATAQVYRYDLDEFSTAEEFREQFYQDCLQER